MLTASDTASHSHTASSGLYYPLPFKFIIDISPSRTQDSSSHLHLHISLLTAWLPALLLQCCTAMNCCFRHTLNTYLHRYRLRDRSRSVIPHFTSHRARNYERLRCGSEYGCMHVLSSWALFPRIALRAACVWEVV